MKHYLKLYKSKNFEELKLNLIKSIKNIKKEHYENYHKAQWACHQRWRRYATRLCRYGYFTYAYNKESYKKKKNSKKSSKHRILKIYKD